MRTIVFVLCCIAVPAGAWWGNGHVILSEAAVRALPAEVPAFFRAGSSAIAAASIDADLHKNRALPNVNETERAEHFIDLELLEGAHLPAQRYAFIALCYEVGVEPERVGLVPYALAEWTGRLTVAFAEHRRWPDDGAIQAKCLVYAGFVAHYAQDLTQPLHTTVHYDGMKQPDGTRIGKGIHELVDSSVERLGLDPIELAKGLELAVHDSLMSAIVAALDASHARVGSLYDIGDAWEDVDDEGMQALCAERARAAAELTGSLLLTAWRRSEGLWLPGWLTR